MRPDLFKLLSYGIDSGLRVSIAPSVTRLLSRNAIFQLANLGAARIAISLDGPDALTHDRFRGVDGSFDATLEAIRTINEAGLSLQINTTVTNYNVHKLNEVLSRLKSFRVTLWSLFFLVPTGRGRVKDMISPSETERVLNWLYDMSRTVEFDVKTTSAPHYRRVFIQRRAIEGDGGRARAVPARDGIARVVGVTDGRRLCFISHIGEILPSGFLPIPAGNVRRESIIEIYRNSRLFMELQDPDKLKGKCGICEFRWICGGSRARAYALTGDYLAEEPCCVYQPHAG